MADLKTLAQAAAAALTASGWQSPQAQAAVRSWQTAHGPPLTVDGWYGPLSAKAMAADLQGQAPPPHTPAPGQTHDSVLQSIATKANLHLVPAPTGSAAAQGFVLRDAVLGGFEPWTVQFEGYTPFPYTDIKGYVTTGIGNLVENIGTGTPAAVFYTLPWKINGRLASRAEMDAAWHTVKSAWPGVQSMASAKLTNLRLDADGIKALVNAKLKENDAYLARRFPSYAHWPADAQLAVNSMAWAMGPGFHFPAFEAAVNQNPPDFNAAAAAAHINEAGNPGVIPRNLADVLLFQNAARVLGGEGDPEALYYLGGVGNAVLGALDAQARIPWWKKLLFFVSVVAVGGGVLAAVGASNKSSRENLLPRVGE